MSAHIKCPLAYRCAGRGKNEKSLRAKLTMAIAFAVPGVVCILSNLYIEAQVPILYYDFENNGTRSIFENAVEQSVNPGSGAISKVGNTTTISGVAGAGILNGGSGAGEAISGSSWSASTIDPGISATDYFQFTVNTSGLNAISVSFDNQASASGPARVGVLYSTDGSAFKIATSPLLTGNGTFSSSGRISIPADADNASTVVVRIYPYASSVTDRVSRGSFSSGGTLRIDNLLVSASQISADKTLLNNPAVGLSIKSGTNFIPAYPNLTISNSAHVNSSTLTLSGALTVEQGSSFILSGGTFTSGGTNNVNGSFQFNSGASTSGGTWLFGLNGGLIYNGGGDVSTGDEWTANSNSPLINIPAFVRIQNNTTLNLPGSDRAVGSIQLIGGNLVLNAAAGDLYVAGDWSRATGSNFVSNGRTIIFFGSANSSISADGNEQFSSLRIDKTNGASINLSTDIRIDNTLELVEGAVNTNANKVAIANATASGLMRTLGYVHGNIQRAIAAGNTTDYLFPLGDATSYCPATVKFYNSVGGNIVVSATAGDHPGLATSLLDGNKSVNRYWTLTDMSGDLASATFDATFEFESIEEDPDASIANFKIGKYANAMWTYPETVVSDASHITASGESGFGDFVIAEKACNLPIIVQQPEASQAVCQYSTAIDLSINAAGESLAYQWYYDTDNSGFDGITITGANGTTYKPSTDSPGTVYYYCVVTGECGSTNAEYAKVTVNEHPRAVIANDPPIVLTCAAPVVQLVAAGGTTYAWSDGNATLGNSANLVVNKPGAYTVMVTAENGCTDQTSITVTEDKNVIALIEQPPSTVLTCNNPGIVLQASGGVNYSWSEENSIVGSSADLVVNNAAVYTVTVTAENGCTDQTSITVTEDKNVIASIEQPPSTVLTCNNPAIVLRASGGANYSWSEENSIVGSAADLVIDKPGIYTVAVIAENGCTDQASITITEDKNVTASIEQPASTILTCSNQAIVLQASGGVTYSWSEENSIIGSSAALAIHEAGVYTVTVTGENGCTDQATISITSSNDATITATYSGNGNIFPSGAIHADCGSNQIFTITPDSCYSISDVLVDGISVGAVASYTFSDLRSAHTITAIFAESASSPSLTCSADVKMNASPLLCSATVNLQPPTASAGCSPIVSVVSDHTATSFPVGTTVVTWTVTDAKNNKGYCRQNVVVTDNQNPTIVCPADRTVNANSTQCFVAGVSLGTPVVSDNCGVTSLQTDAPVQFPVGTTVVTWTVTDFNGNKNSCAEHITVRDKTPPIIMTCAPAQKASLSSGCKVAVPNFVSGIVATDNCTPANQLQINQYPGAGTLVGPGITPVLMTVKDASGNVRICTTSFTVSDIITPAITCPGNINAAVSSGSKCSRVLTVPNPVSGDNCGIVRLTWSMTGATSGSSSSNGINYIGTRTFNTGVTYVTYSARDATGNQATCSFTVNITGNKCLNSSSNAVTVENLQANTKTQNENLTLSVNINPVPTKNFFTLRLFSSSHARVQIEVYDVAGRRIEYLEGAATQTYHFGAGYAAGSYFVEIVQGTNRVTRLVAKQ